MVPIGTLIDSARKEEKAEHHNASSGGGKRPAVPEEDDAQKPTKAARVAEPAAYGKSTLPASNLRVVTSFNADGKPMHMPQWAVKHTAINTSHHGITGGLDGANAPPTAPTLINIETPLYDRLLEHIEEHHGSLADDGWWHYEELQVGAVNELILCARTDKVEKLLQRLEVEGVGLRASGKQPPPLLVLAGLEKELQFYKMSRVWDKMIELGADPDEKFGGESANAVAHAMNSPVLN
jgi:hypothetical protein